MTEVIEATCAELVQKKHHFVSIQQECANFFLSLHISMVPISSVPWVHLYYMHTNTYSHTDDETTPSNHPVGQQLFSR